MRYQTDSIETQLDELMPKPLGFDRLDQKWFAETLLDELGFAHGVGARDDQIENVRDVGEGFVTTIALAVQRHPERTGDVYRAPQCVLVNLLDVVQEALRDAEPSGETTTRPNPHPAPEAR